MSVAKSSGQTKKTEQNAPRTIIFNYFNNINPQILHIWQIASYYNNVFFKIVINSSPYIKYNYHLTIELSDNCQKITILFFSLRYATEAISYLGTINFLCLTHITRAQKHLMVWSDQNWNFKVDRSISFRSIFQNHSSFLFCAAKFYFQRCIIK